MKKFNFDKMENEEKEQEQNLEDIEYAKLEGGIIQALAERERILGIIDEYNLGGQLDGIIEQIKMEPQTIKITPQNRNIQEEAIRNLFSDYLKSVIREEIWKHHELSKGFKEKYEIGVILEGEINKLCMKSHNDVLEYIIEKYL